MIRADDFVTIIKGATHESRSTSSVGKLLTINKEYGTWIRCVIREQKNQGTVKSGAFYF